jgi:integrase
VSIHSRATSAPFLRLLFPEDVDVTASTVIPGEQLAQTLSQFFQTWYLPVVLIGENQSGPSAVKPYREALRRWEAATQHAPLARIDPLLIASVKAALRVATYSRGPGKAVRNVRPATITKWQACLRFILARLGPTNPWEPDKACAGILPMSPSLVVDDLPKELDRVKPSFDLAQAARVMSACHSITGRITRRRAGRRSTIPVPGAPPMSGEWFRAWFGLLFYTGLRADKTALALRRRHCHLVDGAWWLKVPGELVPKTEKAIRLPIHPCLQRLIEESHRRDFASIEPETFLCPWPMGYRHLSSLGSWIAAKAGVDPLRPHAWRRTFGALVADPTKRRLDVAAAALDHASATTTAASYVAIETVRAREILALPDLWPVSHPPSPLESF